MIKMPLLLLLLLLFATPSRSTELSLLVERSFEGLNWTVRTRIYPEFDPHLLWVTAREGGLSVINVSDPRNPIRVAWLSSERRETACLEGQDIFNERLILVNPCASLLIHVDLKGKRPVHGEMEVDWILSLWPQTGALHARWMHNGALAAISNPGYQWITSTRTWNTNASKLPDGFSIIDCDEPAVLISLSPGNLNGTESLTFLYYDNRTTYLLSGGFRSNAVDLFDVSDPHQAYLVDSNISSAYKQMVGAALGSNRALLALWGDPGGLASIEVDGRGQLHQRSVLKSHDLAAANRVKLMGELAFLPLETFPGKIAVVNVSSEFPRRIPSSGTMTVLCLTQTGNDARTTLYALETSVRESGKYVFAVTTDALLRVYRLSVVNSTRVSRE